MERYAHWLSYGELDYICSAPKSAEQHARLCSRVLMRSVIATCLGQGVRLSVRARADFLCSMLRTRACTSAHACTSAELLKVGLRKGVAALAMS